MGSVYDVLNSVQAAMQVWEREHRKVAETIAQSGIAETLAEVRKAQAPLAVETLKTTALPSLQIAELGRQLASSSIAAMAAEATRANDVFLAQMHQGIAPALEVLRTAALADVVLEGQRAREQALAELGKARFAEIDKALSTMAEAAAQQLEPIRMAAAELGRQLASPSIAGMIAEATKANDAFLAQMQQSIAPALESLREAQRARDAAMSAALAIPRAEFVQPVLPRTLPRKSDEAFKRKIAQLEAEIEILTEDREALAQEVADLRQKNNELASENRVLRATVEGDNLNTTQPYDVTPEEFSPN